MKKKNKINALDLERHESIITMYINEKNIIIIIIIIIKFHSLYRSPNIVRAIKSRRLRWAAHVVRMEGGRSAFKVLTGKRTGKRPLERSRRRWEDNNRMNLLEMRGIGLIRVRIVIIGEPL